MTSVMIDRWRLHRLRYMAISGWSMVALIFCLWLHTLYNPAPKSPIQAPTVYDLRQPVAEASLGLNSISTGVLREFIMKTNARVYRSLADEIIDATNKAATKYSLSPALILAIQRAESQFYPFALSNKKAKGLMQLNLESNGRELAMKGIIKNPADEFDPAKNIEGGCYLLRKFVSEEGSLDKALNRYLGGDSSEYKAEVHRALGQILILQVERESGIKRGTQ